MLYVYNTQANHSEFPMMGHHRLGSVCGLWVRELFLMSIRADEVDALQRGELPIYGRCVMRHHTPVSVERSQDRFSRFIMKCYQQNH